MDRAGRFGQEYSKTRSSILAQISPATVFLEDPDFFNVVENRRAIPEREGARCF
jgi:hypothetical protein